jgi:hypothetical protein
MGILLKEWSVLEPDMRALFDGNDSAQKYISEVDSVIVLAVEKMGAKEPVMEIHDIAYYPDMLDEYHTVMEKMLGEVTGKEADQIDSATFQALKRYAEKGQEQWNTIASAEFDSDLYGFSAEKTESLRASIENAQAQERKFVGLAESGEAAAMLAESAKLKGAYTQVYLQFGNFARLKS